MWKTNYYAVLCILTCVILKSISVMGGRDDDEDDEDPYKTTDPKKREPSPCESTPADLLFPCRYAWLVFLSGIAFAPYSTSLTI